MWCVLNWLNKRRKDCEKHKSNDEQKRRKKAQASEQYELLYQLLARVHWMWQNVWSVMHKKRYIFKSARARKIRFVQGASSKVLYGKLGKRWLETATELRSTARELCVCVFLQVEPEKGNNNCEWTPVLGGEEKREWSIWRELKLNIIIWVVFEDQKPSRSSKVPPRDYNLAIKRRHMSQSMNTMYTLIRRWLFFRFSTGHRFPHTHSWWIGAARARQQANIGVYK